jgi:antitoxin component YwqK of YwqJK toxin-antitoxin module
MKKLVYFLSLSIFLLSCGSEDETAPVVEDQNLIETIDGVYYEYYPGKKQVKITGPVDENNKRNERWELYSEGGKQLGFTMYEHGIRQGHSYSSYPNGAPLYHGEYWADTLIGVWKSYNQKGEVTTKDYGLPEGY